MAYAGELLLGADVDGAALVKGEVRGGSVGVVVGEGDPDAHQVTALLHPHRTAALRRFHLERGEEARMVYKTGREQEGEFHLVS